MKYKIFVIICIIRIKNQINHCAIVTAALIKNTMIPIAVIADPIENDTGSTILVL